MSQLSWDPSLLQLYKCETGGSVVIIDQLYNKLLLVKIDALNIIAWC